jgi:hypothetical protein
MKRKPPAGVNARYGQPGSALANGSPSDSVQPPGMNTPINLDEWVSLAEVARRIPSPRAGRKTHVSTIWRWAKRNRWPVLRRGCWRYVRMADVMTLFQTR